ncbi:MAG TPA: phosphoglycerate kinase [Acidimicrobiales bacterium]|nr:phosphoglycerate kinase [Acidimicrobiales bacterium]
MRADERGGHRPLGVPTLEDLGDVSGRSVLVRADLDIADLEPGTPAHDRRLDVFLPTLAWLRDRGAKVTVCGHRGTVANPGDAAFDRLCRQVEDACPGVSVLPNLAGERERSGDLQLAADLAVGHDFYVNEAFQWCWVPLASIIGPPALLPSAAGLRLAADLELLEPLLLSPPRPFVAVFGSDQSLSRLPGLRGLILRADATLVGGAMALPFLQAIGTQPAPRPETELLRECRACFGLAREIQHHIQLPSDLVWERPDGTAVLAPSVSSLLASVSDIGPTTRLRYAETLRGAGSVLWTGALGRAEDPRFAAGTRAVAAGLPANGHVVLGGDAALAALADVAPAATGVLSATDSAVALLKDGDLPGLAALRGGRHR